MLKFTYSLRYALKRALKLFSYTLFYRSEERGVHEVPRGESKFPIFG